MKIGRKQSAVSENLPRLLLLIALFALGIFLGEFGWGRAAVEEARDPLAFLQTAFVDAELPVMSIDMDFADYNNILTQRAEAIQTGAFIGGEEDFHPATLNFQGAAVPVRLRLQEGRAQNLGENDKWGFEVRVRDDNTILDMERFTLLDPANNNWLNQYAFSLALQREGILTSRYHFVQLFFNGEARGIYAVQEGFEPTLAEAQGRPPGVIVEFDSDLLWRSLRYYGGNETAVFNDPVTNLTADDFQYFEVNTFREASVAGDEILSAQNNQAIGLLRGLQAGELPASQVFDVDQYGTFLALSDLWGAVDGTSLVNLRYYYDADRGKLEPVAYNGNPQVGSDKRINLAATFGDLALQSAYVEAAERVADPDYLSQLQAELEPQLIPLLAALRGENEILVLPWDALRERQTLLNRSLNPIQPVFAYLGPPELSMEAIIQVDVANLTNLPLEIVGFDIDGALFLEANPEWMQGEYADLVVRRDGKLILEAFDETDTAVVRYVRFHLPLTEIVTRDSELDFMRDPIISIATRLVGLDETEPVQLTPAREGYPEQISTQ